MKTIHRLSMECTKTAKRRGKWRRKRRSNKRLREREVRSNARHWMVFPEYVTDARETLATGTMEANAFWKNYAVAQEWQKRHSITWWRSRCVALEHENKVLRDKVRSLARRRGYRDTREDGYRAKDTGNDDVRGESRFDDTNNEDLEFNVTEEMLNFFETSERHKREMRRKYGSSDSQAVHEESPEEVPFVGASESAQMRKEEAELLYGKAGSKILAMETALQSMVERYEDTANPQYWPNIPLKP